MTRYQDQDHDSSMLMPHERLDCYWVAVELYEFVQRLPRRRGDGRRFAQLESSSLSVVLLIAEGAGRTARVDKARFYEMAKGSATESAATLRLLQRSMTVDQYRYGRGLAIRLVQMLTPLSGPPR